ncbi:MAG: 4-(cytidine 5'-diphospho)-2-C-methyl-D-erythritol kinase [Clostridiales bacterium]|nr:4-(cytidine 5'-diphospho)-2-C-methyl-D-erythritol kinase [Clostridiales bacterium]
MENDNFTLKAHAKINWALNVLSRRSDGYHILDMLVQRIDLADVLTFEQAQDLQLHVVNAPEHLSPHDNLVMKAALALKQATSYKGGARISLQKFIPTQAGLGGGSADAAAALLGLNRLWNTQLSVKQLQDIAVTLGADVPLCLCPGLMRVTGIGEHITPVSGSREYPLLLIWPNAGLSTAEVFKAFDLKKERETANLDLATKALIEGNIPLIDESCVNQLQAIASGMLPAINQALLHLKDQGALFTQMTGSGSAVFGMFNSLDQAKQAHAALQHEWPICLMSKTLTR